jgi:hypothetical protein
VLKHSLFSMSLRRQTLAVRTSRLSRQKALTLPTLPRELDVRGLTETPSWCTVNHETSGTCGSTVNDLLATRQGLL